MLVGGGFVIATGVLAGALPDRPAGRPARSSGPSGPRPEPRALAGAAPTPVADGHVFDRVIRGGRVIDPDSGFDAVADVGIDGATVAAIGYDGLEGAEVIDAEGLVVAPGFIDLLSYEPNEYGAWFKIADGVTTNLAMHGLNARAADFFAAYAGPATRPPCHYGGAFDLPFTRAALGIDTRAATASELEVLADEVRTAVADGYLGVDVEPEYTPWVTTEEIRHLAAVAAEEGVPVFFHARYSSPQPAGEDNAAALAEVLAVARETGAAVHVSHLTSTGGTHTMAESIATLEAARAEGVDVTACCYPYDFWATYLGSARFAEGWQERFRISYDDLVVPGTGERLTAESFERERAANTLVAAYAIPEDDVRAALATPWIMLGSDSILEPGDNNHPRAAGTFARTLGRYVRELGVLSLTDALAKMTVLPARRLEAACPALARKGRLQVGADADICVFDPATVVDRATVDDPARESEGVAWVLVSGRPVRTPAGNDRSVRLGDPLRAGAA
jgi:dihydroorotase